MKIGLLNKGPDFWLAGVCSVIFHIVVISLFILISGGDGKSSSSAAKKAPAAVEEKPAPSLDPENPPGPAVKDETPAPMPEKRPSAKSSPSKANPAVRPATGPDEVSLDTVTDTASKTLAPVKPAVKATPVETGSYIVKPGDNLYKIARDHGCTVAELAKLNNTDIKKLSNLRKGQTIRVPKADGTK